jgi:hypothetical protein
VLYRPQGSAPPPRHWLPIAHDRQPPKQGFGPSDVVRLRTLPHREAGPDPPGPRADLTRIPGAIAFAADGVIIRAGASDTARFGLIDRRTYEIDSRLVPFGTLVTPDS